MLLIMPAKAAATSNFSLNGFTGSVKPFSSAHTSHRWYSDILFSTIWVKCRTAGFLPQIWQSMARSLADRHEVSGLEPQDPIRDRGEPIIVSDDDKRLL